MPGTTVKKTHTAMVIKMHNKMITEEEEMTEVEEISRNRERKEVLYTHSDNVHT